MNKNARTRSPGGEFWRRIGTVEVGFQWNKFKNNSHLLGVEQHDPGTGGGSSGLAGTD